ncbi:MAG: DUF1211 domain-containing protein [Thermoleophilia bacterium]|nr:DUF1211 domain-containing protein [Thermoleophilia bacterium]
MESTTAATETPAERSEDLSRMAALTDGVIAIAITLLVLDIAVPEIPDALVSEELGSALWELRPEVFAFVLSFTVIAYYWLAHRLVFSHLRTIDVPLMVINLFFLLMIAFMPFAASLLAEYVPDGLAVACYAGIMSLAGFSQLAMVAYPGKTGHFHVDVNPSHVRLVTKKVAVAPIVYLIAIPVAFINGWAALAMLVLIPIGRYVISRRSD